MGPICLGKDAFSLNLNHLLKHLRILCKDTVIQQWRNKINFLPPKLCKQTCPPNIYLAAYLIYKMSTADRVNINNILRFRYNLF